TRSRRGRESGTPTSGARAAARRATPRRPHRGPKKSPCVSPTRVQLTVDLDGRPDPNGRLDGRWSHARGSDAASGGCASGALARASRRLEGRRQRIVDVLEEHELELLPRGL